MYNPVIRSSNSEGVKCLLEAPDMLHDKECTVTFLYIGATLFESMEPSELCEAMPKAILGQST